MVGGQVLADGAGEEEDEDDGGGDPEGPVEVRVAVEDVEEGSVGEGQEGGEAAVQDGGGVDVEELGVEGEGPEVAFRRYRTVARGRLGGGGQFGVAGCGVVEV